MTDFIFLDSFIFQLSNVIEDDPILSKFDISIVNVHDELIIKVPEFFPVEAKTRLEAIFTDAGIKNV